VCRACGKVIAGYITPWSPEGQLRAWEHGQTQPTSQHPYMRFCPGSRVDYPRLDPPTSPG
jgi:hypothetical protein